MLSSTYCFIIYYCKYILEHINIFAYLYKAVVENNKGRKRPPNLTNAVSLWCVFTQN